MDTFITTSGFGAIKDARTGRIVSKCDLPPGEHPLADGYVFVEVEDRAGLDAIKIDPPLLSLKQRRERHWRRLEADMHSYIFDAHGYPEPTQITVAAICNDPDRSDRQRAACKAILGWINGLVLPYYYGLKAQILASEEPEATTWDFAAACDADAAGLMTLAQIIRMSA